MRKATTRRPGLTFLETIASLVLVGVLAAVVVPGVSGYVAMKKATTTAGIFQSLGFSLNNNNLSLGHIGFVNQLVAGAATNYPSHLSHLTSVISTLNTGASGKRCNGTAYVAADSTNWLKSAPYSGLVITFRKGVTTPLGVIRDTVVKGSGSTLGLVELQLDSVGPDDAHNLDMAIDGAVDSANGQLRYNVSPSVSGLRLVKFVLPGYGC